jgi:hypothetical protein
MNYSDVIPYYQPDNQEEETDPSEGLNGYCETFSNYNVPKVGDYLMTYNVSLNHGSPIVRKYYEIIKITPKRVYISITKKGKLYSEFLPLSWDRSNPTRVEVVNKSERYHFEWFIKSENFHLFTDPKGLTLLNRVWV